MAAAGFQYVPDGFDYDVYQTAGTDRSTPRLIHTDAPDADPNDAIVAGLTVSERIAYYHALYGGQVQLDDHGNLAGPSLTSTDEGCAGS